MAFGDTLSSAWKLYRLHQTSIITIIALCTLLPFLLLLLVSFGLAHGMGVVGTLAQYGAAQEHYQALLSSGFMSGMTETLQQTLEAQGRVVEGLQRELLPFLAVRGLLSIVVGLIGLLGTFALLLGFFGKFGNPRMLLREAQKRYLSLFGTLIALFFLLFLGCLVLFAGLALISYIAQWIAQGTEVGSLVFGALGFLAFCWLGLYWFSGIVLTLYEALARKTVGFGAVRGVWARMEGQRLFFIGQSLLLALVVFLCFLPLFALKLLVAFGSFASLGMVIEGLIFLAYTFVATPVIYFFYGLLYKQL